MYALNNPLRFIDPSGYSYSKPTPLEREYINGEHTYINHELTNKYGQASNPQLNGNSYLSNSFTSEDEGKGNGILVGSHFDPITGKTYDVYEDPMSGKRYYLDIYSMGREIDENYNVAEQFAYSRVYLDGEGDPTVQGYDGSYMIPSAAYDYSINGPIEGKFQDDWNYIRHGEQGTAISRYFQLLARDVNAASSGAKIELGINIAGSLLPFLRVGKLAVPFKGFTAHGVNQAITKGISSQTILNVIRNGNSTIAVGRYGSQIRYYYQGTTVVVGTSGRNAGKIITVW